MRIIEDWLSIPCAWCREIIDFQAYHYFRSPDLQFSGIRHRVFALLGGRISDQQMNALRSNFIAFNLNLSSEDTYIFICREDDKVLGDCVGVVFTCSPECKDQFDLNVMNVINDKIVENGVLLK